MAVRVFPVSQILFKRGLIMNLFLTNYNLIAEIGISNVGGTWTYAPLCEGIDNIAETLNEVIQEYYFLCGKGFGMDHITGMHPKWTFSGRRILGDAAQDYIASTKYLLDTGRESSFRISYVDNSGASPVTPLVTVPCTFTNIQDIGGGAATDDSVFSVEISFKGQPTLSNVLALPALNVVSVPGSSAGKTAIYVNPILTDGNSYKYLTAATVTLPEYGTAPVGNWQTWDGSAAITATTGNYIGIVELDSSGNAVAGGTALVTSMQ